MPQKSGTRTQAIADARARSNANLLPHQYQRGPEWRGNTEGWTVSVKEARAIARDRSVDGMNRLVELMYSPDDRVAVVAVNSVLDRGLGKVKEEPEPVEDTAVDVALLTAAERDTLKALLLASVRRARTVAQPADTITEPAAEVLPPEDKDS